MTCVKETFPPRVRFRWLLITMRLSASSFAGTARTLVAVGTVSESSMFFAIAAAAPRSCFCSVCALCVTGLAFAACCGVALPVCGSVAAGLGCAAGLGAAGAALPLSAAGGVTVAVVVALPPPALAVAVPLPPARL